MTPADPPRLLTLGEAAAYLGLSAATIRRQVSAGHLPPPQRYGRAVRWDRRALDAALDRRSGLAAEWGTAGPSGDERGLEDVEWETAPQKRTAA